MFRILNLLKILLNIFIEGRVRKMMRNYIDWSHFQETLLHEAFLRKSKQTGFSERYFCADYEYFVCEFQICLIR